MACYWKPKVARCHSSMKLVLLLATSGPMASDIALLGNRLATLTAKGM